MVLEATTLPTEPQPLPNIPYLPVTYCYIILGIMPHCIDGNTLEFGPEFCPFDGRNWEEEIKKKAFVKELSADVKPEWIVLVLGIIFIRIDWF